MPKLSKPLGISSYGEPHRCGRVLIKDQVWMALSSPYTCKTNHNLNRYHWVCAYAIWNYALRYSIAPFNYSESWVLPSKHIRFKPSSKF